MATHPYRFTVEDLRGKDVLVYEGIVEAVGRVRVQTDGTTVSLVYLGKGDETLEPRQVAPLVLATAKDPGPDVQLRLRRVAINRQRPGRPIIKDVRR